MIGVMPDLEAALANRIVPARVSRSVRASAGIPYRAAVAIRSSGDAVPNLNEYPLTARRWMNGS